MDILKLIKNRRTIRRYQNKPVPKQALDKIIEAGIWGPSVPSFLRLQPWRFVVVRNKKLKAKIFAVIQKKAKASGAGVNLLLNSAANIVNSADTVIAVYNSGDMDKIKDKFKETYRRFESVIGKAQLSAISAAIQNMILTAYAQGIGSCWLDMPLFCKEEINRLLKTNNELVAFLTLGYPAEAGKRAPRKPHAEAVKYV